MSGYNSVTLSEAVARRRAVCPTRGCDSWGEAVSPAVIMYRPGGGVAIASVNAQLYDCPKCGGRFAVARREVKKLSEAQEFAMFLARRDGRVWPGGYQPVSEQTLLSLVRHGLLTGAVNPATGLLEYRPVRESDFALAGDGPGTPGSLDNPPGEESDGEV